MSRVRLALVTMLAFSLAMRAKGSPTGISFDTIDGVTLLDSAKVICTEETTNLCQRCAKKTKSSVVYPWCCADHEGVREWCTHYLHFGLP